MTSPGVCIVLNNLMVGGLGTWTLDVVASLPPAGIALTGVGIVDPSLVDLGLVARLQTRVPVVIGAAPTRALAAASDLALVWGVRGWSRVVHPARAVVVSHGPGPWTTQWIGHEVVGAAGAAAVSAGAATAFPRGVRPRVAILPNAVDPGRLRPRATRAEVRASWGVPRDAPVVGYLGRFSSEKGSAVMPGVARHLPEAWHVVMVGRGFDEPAIRAAAAAAGPRVHVMPVTDDVGGVLAAFDVVAVPSDREGLAYVAVEAWLSRTPVLMTATGAAVEHPTCVRLLPTPPTSSIVAAAVLADAADPARPARVERAARVAAEVYAPAAFGARWAAYLRGVARQVAEGPPPAPLPESPGSAGRFYRGASRRVRAA